MTTTELGPCEWFIWDLRRSNLVDRGQIDQLVGDFLKKNARAEPPALAQFLVDQGVISPFQAERLLQGKSQGLVLGPYVLVDALGSGSMGTVYKAHSKNDQRLYAVKVLPRRSMWNVRIARRQVRSFEQLHHPAVVPFVDVGTAGSTHYLAWPLIEGETLEHLVQRQGKLPAGLATHYTLQAAEGLDACHRQGIVHGLLKPSNVMIAEEHQVRLLDFGIGSILANSEGESLVDTMSTANALTSGLDCASPESIVEPTNRTPAGDQYSLGCVLYFALTGRYPFAEETAVEKMMAHQMKQATPVRELVPEVPEELAAVIDRLMQKKPESRYASATEVIEALTPWASTDVRLGAPSVVRAVRESAPRNAPPASPPAEPGSSKVTRTVETVERSSRTPLPPTRASLRQPSPPVAARAPDAPRPKPVRNPAALIPPTVQDEPRTVEDRVGPLGVFLGALLAASVTWLLSLWLFR